MTPVPLDSPRWATLRAHFGNAGVDGDLPAVPTLLRRWNHAVGSYAEEYEYQDLFESYLHQRTILDVAYAVVPHLAARLSELDPDRRVSVLDDLALVEETRLVPPHEVDASAREIERTVDSELLDIFLQSLRDRHPPLPDDLAPAYLAAIEQAKDLAGADWGRELSERPGPQHYRRHVRHLRASGWKDADIAFGFEVLTRKVDGHALVWCGHAEALAGLRAVTGAPPGWFERTHLRSDDDEHHLGFLALNSLAWLSAKVGISTMLRTR